jgi:hypothetical protein
MDNRVFIYWDNSNTFIGAKFVANKREGIFAEQSVRIQFDRLLDLARAGRLIASAVCVGSIPPELRHVWDRIRSTGVSVELYERGAGSGTEQATDQALQVHMLRAMHDIIPPQVAVLLTGDGAGYEEGVGFYADLVRMAQAGWGIEVISWDAICKREFKEWAKKVGVYIALDDYYESVTFLEHGRRSIPLKLSSRPMASVRPGPVQLAEMRAKQEAEREIQSLKQKLEKANLRKATKDKKRERYMRKIAKRQRKTSRT